ncbi:pseudaminic acid synthase [Cohnella sp. GCM10012308]|uniref:pseudaminic acid synthase n=1 Tax=Cohnella sp. GCM10012308 TaxID=3317329 RepID=UPI0036158E37
MNAIEIAGIRVGDDAPPFMIAEMSGNHNQSLDRALKIVEAAAKAGAHAIKLQTYTADTMTLDISSDAFAIPDGEGLWGGKSLYELYRQASTPWAWHPAIFEYGRKLGLIVFSSPFDASAVDFLESLGAPCYKIASFEITDLPLIRRAASTGKPVILSTGMATLAEVDEAVTACREAGSGQIALLKCTSSYPAPVDGANLATIPHMQRLFDCPVGLSDHTLGLAAAVASVALGAAVIEKHFTLSRSEGGVDAAFSMEPAELKQLTAACRDASSAIGRVSYGPSSAERDSLRFRRSIYAVKDIAKGEPLSKANIAIIRPGYGLAPKHYDTLIGKNASKPITRGSPIGWEMI